MISNKIKMLFGAQLSWPEVERFDERWRSRIEVMSSFISEDDSSIVDLGCGPMWLKDYIKSECKYVGVDYKDRGPDSYVCDLNNSPYLNVSADVYFISGCLEYIEAPEKLIELISKNTRHKCILSYCCMERFPEVQARRRRGWKNHLTHPEVISLFTAKQMVLRENLRTEDNNDIFVFSACKRSNV